MSFLFRTSDQLNNVLGTSLIQTAEVEHCQNSFGIAITDSVVGKIVFSGDCVPDKNLVACGVNAQLLIHEATFEDGKEADAAFKKHSTVSQAIKVANE
jgi:ribonuclease Z